MDAELKDIVGVPFKVGDEVVTYVCGSGRAELRVGRVRAQAPNGGVVTITYELDGRKTTIERKPDGVVKVA